MDRSVFITLPLSVLLLLVLPATAEPHVRPGAAPTMQTRPDPLTLIEQHLPPLQHDRGERWPIMIWEGPPDSLNVLEALLDAGVAPMFIGVRTFRREEALREAIPQLRRIQDRGIPLIILPQGLVQLAFARDGAEDHLPPARPKAANPNFRCPALLYDVGRLQGERSAAARIARTLKDHGIVPTSIWLDFETGAYLRNRYEAEQNVRLAMHEASRCRRCRDRFRPEAFESLEEYRQAVDQARAHAIRFALVEPVRAVFPEVLLGNFFAWPHNRIEQPDGVYPAYGYGSSGLNVALPRRYFIPGWGGNARSTQEEVDWNIFRSALSTFSPVAEVIEPGEKLVPWVAYAFRQSNARRRASRGAKIASGEAYQEMVRHLMMRGAETIAIFTRDAVGADLPPEYPPDFDRRDLGPFFLNVVDVQRAYDEMLAFNDHLRCGTVLNYEIGGASNRLDESAAVWSGVATERRALIRTVSFGPELCRTIRVFDRDVELPFEPGGRFFWVYPDGRVERLESVSGRSSEPLVGAFARAGLRASLTPDP